ncbi:globin [Helicobacter aurati]|uniref:Globin n=1 Tax=Helicobacter aurati TaxID=137778 RepID=A0A3D8J254_9HELI|nr:globin domain-containing protein [Helicobacter aurati]RDU71578.1 globin [Helicobacter aurati]
MTQQQIQIIKDCIPALEQHGKEITKEFYRILFEDYPEVKPLFNPQKQESEEQPKALATAILKAAQNIENLDALTSFVDKVAHTHVKLQVQPEHYPLVGTSLLKAIKNILNPDDRVLEAWGAAYDKIAQFYIARESELYDKQENK